MIGDNVYSINVNGKPKRQCRVCMKIKVGERCLEKRVGILKARLIYQIEKNLSLSRQTYDKTGFWRIA